MTNGERDLSQLSMLDLFSMEVETQVEILSENLLALEQEKQSPKQLEALMRAAHSIKGAARIVQVDAAVKIAHVMEDYFVAAREEAIVVAEPHIDVLLEGVDWLSSLGKVSEEELESWLEARQEEVNRIESRICAIATGATREEPPSTSTESPEVSQFPTVVVEVEASEPAIAPQEIVSVSDRPVSLSPTPQDAPPNPDRVVRLSAENLNRLMGLAGESLIEANWLQPFADALLNLKNRHRELSRTLENLEDSLSVFPLSKESESYLKAARSQQRECHEILSDRINDLELFTRRFANLSDRLYREAIDSQMRPFAEGTSSFPRMMRDLAKQLGKQVKFEIHGKSTKVDRDILDKLEAPLMHILRNAIDHGIESMDARLAAGKSPEGTIRIEATHRGGMLSIEVCDDGRGIDLELLRQTAIAKQAIAPDLASQLTETELMEFLFLPSFSTVDEVTEISGRGVGLDIAKSVVQEVGGLLKAHSQRGKGTTFHLQLPLTLSVIRTLLVEISGEPYAFPLTRIEQILQLTKQDLFLMENRQYFTLNGQNIGLVSAHQVLELKEGKRKGDRLSVIILSDRSSYYGLVVDRFLGERDLVVRPLDPRLGKVRDISAAALMEDGSPVLIVDVEDLVRSIDKLLSSGRLSHIRGDETVEIVQSQKRILVVDDSITVREMERKLLENNGYHVDVAVDGIDAWNAARTGHYDLIITDVDMPRMNGIELVEQLKSHPQLKFTPAIVVSYKDREEDRLLGLEAGANYYLTKSSFHDNTFLQAVIDTIGESNFYPSQK